MEKILITGGAGFIGSHAAEFFANQDYNVSVIDNLSRAQLLHKRIKNTSYNFDYLRKFKNVTLIKGDITDLDTIGRAMKEMDFVFHAAAQTAVTTSIDNPHEDFMANALGTFNVLEAARKNDVKALSFCSTNKVFGNNVNQLPVIAHKSRYMFADGQGVSENFSVDLTEHTPYGCSKLAGDLYVQDYSYLYGLRTGVFRMSCIYGTRQFGMEDQGWVAWLTIATLLGKPINIFGDGKQVRDVLYVTDLIRAHASFLSSNRSGVYCTGGGASNTLSLLELLDYLEDLTGKRSPINFYDWRPSDQRVFVSDISKLKEDLGWNPTIPPKDGVKKIVEWVNQNKNLF